MAMAGLSIVGRDRYGVFPLKGKILNVRDPKNIKKLQENSEISNIKKIVGLKTGQVYKDVSELRYGKVMLLTDQDEDGSHIKGLLFNMFQTLWPSLFNYPGFLNSMLTPIVKTKKGKVEKMLVRQGGAGAEMLLRVHGPVSGRLRGTSAKCHHLNRNVMT